MRLQQVDRRGRYRAEDYKEDDSLLSMGHKHNEPRDIPIAFEDESGLEELDGDQILADHLLNPEELSAEGEETRSEKIEGSGLASDPSADGADDPTSTLQEQIDTLTREKAALYDQLLRRTAEFENYRRRLDRDRTDAYQRARVEVLLEFLPVVDNFERALSSLESSGGDAEALHKGVELIHKQFKDALTKFGLEPIDAIGRTFDPHLHEAVTIEATDKHEENTVLEEFQRGYKIGDKLLRPSKVKVASTPR
ncbi:MAG TPA: nucleotide exchange factor GrpE [Blastocatellia bacterium]|nr:nucleotide exchange factor GrpE [Blastocatellia bacterium]